MTYSQYNELDLINILVCMCLEEELDGIENVFTKHGYNLISIDRNIDTSVGTIKYDLIISNKLKEYSLGFELKGNKASNLETDQLEKYKNVSSSELVKFGGLNSFNSEEHKLQTIIGINNHSSENVISFLEEQNYSFPVLAVDTSNIQIKHIRIIDNEINNVFKSPLIYKSFISLIKYDKDTPLENIAPDLIAIILKYSLEGKSNFTVDEVIDDLYCSIPNVFQIIGGDVKKAVRRKIIKLLDRLSKTELSVYLEWDSINQYWYIHRLHPDAHPNTLSSFREKGVAFVNRIREGKAYKQAQVNAGQLSLFDEDEYN
ncbi:hypothetical protein [Piscibacillus salipiscarius]|uniref:Uncharacterized protein n=1 Tax=Piscibacillus salipiscarius TaxID=299480 RepID=A0ABW5QB04_9BACI|nr:hypothetical protein [Piscibacillus salipiscarius]